MLAPFARRLLLGIAMSALALPALAQTGAISGKVTETGTNRPIANAGVRAVSGLRAVAGAYTDESGNFRIANVPAGTYTVEARLVGYRLTRVEGAVVGSGAAAAVDIVMTPIPSQLEQVITTASRRPEKVIDAPATVSVVNSAQINERPSINVADHVAALPGIDVARGGLMRSNIVARGFNNIFSGAMMTLTDNRFAFVPSLRVNIPYLSPTVNEDIERIEVVLGPGAALYGPNTTSGVMALFTKSPFGSEGTTVTVDAGNQSVLRGSFRTAWTTPSKKFGVKATYEAFKGTEWPFLPSDTVGEQKRRDPDLNRQGGEIRVDLRPTPATEIIANYGRSKAGSAIEPTGLGPAQVRDWVYQTAQVRGRYKTLFGQVFMNTSDAGGTYLLHAVRPTSACPEVSDPACIIDRSRQIVGQLQHEISLGSRERFLYGFDYIYTEPRTEATINGRNEDDDDISEKGGYIHSVTQLSNMFELTAAARVDKHSRLEDPVFSPRLALVYKPVENQNLRVTYNRAFSTPSTLNLFLDLLAGRIPPTGTQLFGVRALGVPTTGLTFRRDCTGGVGGLCMRVPAAFGGNPANPIPANAALLYKAAIAAAGPSLVAGGVPASLVAYLGSLQPGPTEVGTKLRVLQSNATFTDVAPTDLRDVNRLKPEIHNTIEAGYKGIIANKLQVSLDVWHEKRENFVGPLIVETPNVFLDATTLGPFLAAKLAAIGVPAAQIAVLAPTIAGALGGVSGGHGAAVGVPLGVVNFNEALSSGSDVILTYRNFGKLNLWGSDLGAEYLLWGPFSVQGTYSYVNKKLFPRSEVGGVQDISLNAPANKHSLAINYRDEAKGVTAELRERHVDGYRASAFIDGEIKPYTLVDVNVSLRPSFLNGVMWSLSGTNLLDKKHQEFVQGEVIGRLVMTRLQVTF